MYFMIQPYNVQVVARNGKKGIFARFARAVRVRSKIQQRQYFGIGIPTAHSKFCPNRSIFGYNSSKKTWTEAISLRVYAGLDPLNH